MEILSRNSEVLCSLSIEINTTDKATLPTGKTGCIETSNTTVKPSHYRIKDSNTLIYSAFHTYHSDITEPTFFIKLSK